MSNPNVQDSSSEMPGLPFEHFLKQFKVQKTLTKTKKGNALEKRVKGDSYNFMTFAVKRFIIDVSKIVEESDKTFDLWSWQFEFPKDLFDEHNVAQDLKSINNTKVDEPLGAIRYLESVFGSLPNNSKSTPIEVSVTQFGFNGSRIIDAVSPNRKSNLQAVSAVKTLSKNKRIEKVHQVEGKAQVQVIIPTQSCSNAQTVDAEVNNSVSNTTDSEVPRESLNTKRTTEAQDEDFFPPAPKRKKINKKKQFYLHNYPKSRDETVSNSSLDSVTESLPIVQLRCVYCFETNFATIQALSAHYKDVHRQPDAVKYYYQSEESTSPANPQPQTSDNHMIVHCGLCMVRFVPAESCSNNTIIQRFIQHYLSTHQTKLYCTYCGLLFYHDTILNEHVKYCESACSAIGHEMPSEKHVLYCYMKRECECHQIYFTDEFLYADHFVRFHIHESEGGELCQALGMDVKSLFHARNDMLYAKYSCPMCPTLSFANPHEWLDHAGENHPESEWCDICCQFVQRVKTHVKNAHGVIEEYYFSCLKPECSFRGAYFGTLYEHILHKHPDVNLNEPVEFKRQCIECSFSVPYPFDKTALNSRNSFRNISSHYASNHAVRRKANTKKYSVDKKNKKFCEKCGKFFTFSSYFVHMKRHIAEESGEWHTCSKCPARYADYQGLIQHEKKHNSHGCSFICEICSKGFFSKKSLEIHTKQKHTNHCYQCRKCGLTFASDSGQRKHERKVCFSEDPNYRFALGKLDFGEGYKQDGEINTDHGFQEVVVNEDGSESVLYTAAAESEAVYKDFIAHHQNQPNHVFVEHNPPQLKKARINYQGRIVPVTVRTQEPFVPDHNASNLVYTQVNGNEYQVVYEDSEMFVNSGDVQDTNVVYTTTYSL